MQEVLKRALVRHGLDGLAWRLHRRLWRVGRWRMRFPPYAPAAQRAIAESLDPIRYATLAMAAATVLREEIPGAFAELGVYRGETSSFLHERARERTLYLFDTFEGFPDEDLAERDERFMATSVEGVRRYLGDTRNVVFRKGRFPESAEGLEDETYALVMLDADLFDSTLSGLEHFYPRLNHGAFLFLHDYNNQESDRAVSRALQVFQKGIRERAIEIPDCWGTVVLRKA